MLLVWIFALAPTKRLRVMMKRMMMPLPAALLVLFRS